MEEQTESKKNESKEEQRNLKSNFSEKGEFIPIDKLSVSSLVTSLSR